MELLQKGIDAIIRDKKLIELLNSIEINSVEELCNHSQKELSEKQIPNFYIKDITIALQSNGLDLKKNRKKKIRKCVWAMEKITDKYYIGSNKNTFILYEKRISETTGKETYKNIGYIATLESVYSTLLEKEIREDTAVLNNIKKITDMVNELREFTKKYVEEHLEKFRDNN